MIDPKKVKKKSTGKYYYRQQREGSRVQITVEASNREEAIERIERELGINSEGITLSELSKKYARFKAHRWQEKTKSFNRENHRDLINFYGEDKIASQITLEEAEKYRQDLVNNDYSHNTIVHRMTYLKALYRFASLSSELRVEFPFNFLGLLNIGQTEKSKKEVPTIDSIILFFKNINNWNKNISLLMLCTGMRSFEARSIRANWISWEYKEINIPTNLENERKTKTKKPRTIPMVDTLYKVLFNQMKIMNIDDGLIFPAKDGQVRDQSMRSIKNTWLRLGKDYSPHNFRNMFTSIMKSDGFADAEISHITGWNKQGMVEYYNRLYDTEEYKKERLVKMNQLFSFISPIFD